MRASRHRRQGEETEKGVKKTKPAYLWDDERGVVAVGKNDTTQAIQLLQGPASYAFRAMCGKLLVDALNRRARRKA